VSTLEVRVSQVRRATPSTKQIRIDLLGASFNYQPGQAVILALADDFRMPYSIASAPMETERDGYLELLTHIDPGTRLSHVRRGSRVTLQGPFGSFILPAAPTESSFLFVAGGTGIAPLRSMIRQAVLSGRAGTLRLLYSARTPADFAYLAELRKLAGDRKLDLALTATREVPARWRGDRGRITRDRLSALIDTPETLCFVCGPASMVDDVPRMLRELGVANERIRIEEW
jgi:ferredoxin-NADP reductase